MLAAHQGHGAVGRDPALHRAAGSRTFTSRVTPKAASNSSSGRSPPAPKSPRATARPANPITSSRSSRRTSRRTTRFCTNASSRFPRWRKCARASCCARSSSIRSCRFEGVACFGALRCALMRFASMGFDARRCARGARVMRLMVRNPPMMRRRAAAIHQERRSAWRRGPPRVALLSSLS